MGGWNTMPGFCSWGLSPLPSSGVKASRANGFAANSITVTKNAATAHTTPATYGSSGAWRRDVNVDRKSTRLNSSHGYISYAVFCLKKKKKQHTDAALLRSH